MSARRPTRQAIALLLALGGGVMLTAGPADAHAFLRSATPPVGATVPAPRGVAITFTEAVEPAFSSIVVTDAHGARVDDGAAPAASADGLRLSVALKPLGPGTYSVTWHATSVDTHKTEGRFDFTVAP